MNKLGLASFIFLMAPFCFSCNHTVEYDVTITKNKDVNPKADFSYTFSRKKALRGADFYVYFKPDKYYDVTADNINIYIDNSPFPLDKLPKTWSYDEDKNTLKLCGEVVTGKIRIDVAADYGQYTYKVVTNGWKHNKEESGGVISFDVDASVPVGFTDITITDSDFKKEYVHAPSWLTWNYVESEQKIVVNPDQFYNDIVITLEPKK